MKNTADEIGTLRASIASLRSELAILEKAAKFDGPHVIEGELYRVVVSQFDKVTTPWKAVAEALGTPAQVERVSKRLSKTSITTKLTCSGHIKAAA